MALVVCFFSRFGKQKLCMCVLVTKCISEAIAVVVAIVIVVVDVVINLR